MKDHRIQTKRQAKKGLKALYARTVKKKHHATTATADELEGDVPSVGIGRALTVILILHIVAIAAIWVGINWKGDSSGENSAAVTEYEDQEKDNPKAVRNVESSENVGRLTRDRPASYNIGSQAATGSEVADVVSDRPDLGLNEAPPARQPRVIRPTRNPNIATPRAATHVSTGRVINYKVVGGDSVYRIAQRHNVKTKEIEVINPGLNPSKIKPGQIIKIPVR